MIYTVTFNPAIDYIIRLDKLTPGAINRVNYEQVLGGGKGVNVSIVLGNLGHKSTATGFLAGFTGDEIVRQLREFNAADDFVKLDEGFSRINVKVKADVEKADGSLFWASNFSIGVNVFVAMQKYVARIMNQYPQYDVTLQETHHIHKLDSPSGTAITIADAITDNLERKQGWKETACIWQHEDQSVDVSRNAEVGTTFQSHQPEDLEVVAFRRGEVPGIHTVVYDSEVDTITMTHSAKSRRGFALGAVVAAEWMGDGKKGVYTMTDLMKF